MRRGLVGNIYVIKTIYLICVHDLMTDLRPDLADDEIDLRELFAVLWHGKWLIFSLCCVALLLASVYLHRAPPYEPAPGNFAAVPSVDFSLANYRYVAVNAAP